MFAVIKSGGKQYLVSPGDKIKIEKLQGDPKKKISFEEVLLLSNDKEMKIGQPKIEGAKVVGEILNQGKGKKLVVFKYRAKKRSKVKKGHRQPFTEVEIKNIQFPKA